MSKIRLVGRKGKMIRNVGPTQKAINLKEIAKALPSILKGTRIVRLYPEDFEDAKTALMCVRDDRDRLTCSPRSPEDQKSYAKH